MEGRYRKDGHKASKKFLLPFRSMLNIFALMAPRLQLRGNPCARSSSSQRSRWWLSCPSLLQTWAWHCLLQTWWCLQSSSGTRGYASLRGQGLGAPWRAERLALQRRCIGESTSLEFSLSFSDGCLSVHPQVPRPEPLRLVNSLLAGEDGWKANMLLFLNLTELSTTCPAKTWKDPSSVLTLYFWNIHRAFWEPGAPVYFLA